MTRPLLLVTRGADSWLVRFVDDPEVVRLFGTDTLPAPFEPAAAVQDVLATVRRLNPGCDVRLGCWMGGR